MPERSGLIFKLVIENGNRRLAGADLRTDEWLNEIKIGRLVLMIGRTPRNPLFHMLAWGVVRKVQENDPQERWGSPEALMDDLKIATGLYEKRHNWITGEPYIKAGSISFGSMGEAEFKPWFMRAVDALCSKILVGTDEQDLIDEVFASVHGNDKSWRFQRPA
jgi:hypothetical protein